MASISGKETKPEILVRKFLFSKGFRYRKNDKRYPGKPDIVLPKYQSIIFINGCYWHGHSCNYGKLPNTRKEFWKSKISQNIERDKMNIRKLEKQGWRVIVIWQCELKNKEVTYERLKKLRQELSI